MTVSVLDPVRGSGEWSPRAGGVAAAPPLRLTGRGRRLLGALVGGALAGLVLLGTAVLPGRTDLDLAARSSVVVQPGDTVWSIAVGLAGEGQDVRGVVDTIRTLNDLDDVTLVPGQVLDVP